MPEKAVAWVPSCKYGCYLAVLGGLIKLIWAILGLAGIIYGFGLNLLGSTFLSLVLSLIFAILILIFAYAMCWMHKKWAVYVVIILAILNILFGFELFYCGSILVLIGAAMVLKYCYKK